MWAAAAVLLLTAMPVRGLADYSLLFSAGFFAVFCLFLVALAAFVTWLVLDVETLRLTGTPIVPAKAKWFATSGKGLGEARMTFSPVWAIPLGLAVVGAIAAGFGELVGVHRFFLIWGAVFLLPLLHVVNDRPRVLLAIAQHAGDHQVKWKRPAEVLKRPRVIVALIQIWIPAMVAVYILLRLFGLSIYTSLLAAT